jgi:D-Tyr-tRNAtyr deacylase
MKNYQDLLNKVEKATLEKKIDLSSGEDLSLGIMNLISIEEHLFYTAEKTKNQKYLDLLNEVRLMRTELMRKIIKDYEGEVWCISKHLLSASMRLMEVGTKELKKGNKKEANEMFEKSFKLYSLFWGINLKAIDLKDIPQMENDISLIDDKSQKVTTASVFDKLGSLVQKALDCCRE